MARTQDLCNRDSLGTRELTSPPPTEKPGPSEATQKDVEPCAPRLPWGHTGALPLSSLPPRERHLEGVQGDQVEADKECRPAWQVQR